MEVSRISILLNLLWFATCIIVSHQAAIDCDYGSYWDSVHRECRPCSPCPLSVIRKESQGFASMYQCERYTSLCPDWCSVEVSSLSGANDGRAREACPPTTPSPPVPFVNVTIDGPKYNETASSYTASCAMYFSDMDTPRLEWSNPSGQALASTDTLGKWKITQEVVTQGAMSVVTLVINDFQKGDEGNYSCSAHGEQIANQTILLKYVEPPTTTPPDTSPPGTSPPPQQSTAKPEETFKPKSPISTTVLLGAALGAVIAFLLLALIVIYLKQRCSRHFVLSTSDDIEKVPLNDIRSMLSLETSNFQSATIVGIQACLDHPYCDTVIIIQNKKRIPVKNIENKDQNKFFISNMSWDDKLEVWMKCRDKKKKRIKTLRMNCLKTGNMTATSAVINCPPVNDTFFLRYVEKDSNCSFQPVEALQGGSKEILNLHPKVTYCVELGTKGQTGDSGAYIWDWKEEFTTESLEFQPVTASQSTTGLRLAVGAIPASLDLHYAVNCLDDSKLEELKTLEVEIKGLIPGMEQVVQLKAKERRGTQTEFRLLQDTSFCTAGSVKDFGDYEGDVTTELEEYCPSKPTSKKHSKKGRSKDANKEQCTTGLNAALNNLRLTRTSQKFYHCPDPTIMKAMMECLVDFWKARHHMNPVKPGSLGGLKDIESFLKEKDMQDYTAIFTVLKPFIEREDVHTPAGVDFAKRFLDAHNESCRLCNQAYLLIQWHTNKMNAKPSES